MQTNSNQMHLNKAPIVEALIDLRVQPRPGAEIATLDPLIAQLSDRYPKVVPIVAAQLLFQSPTGNDQAARTVSQSHTGQRLESKDGKYVLQLGIQSFTLSRLSPYETWDALLSESKILWDLYRETMKPETVQRVAVRYINRIELPLPFADFSQYLTAPPSVPKGLPELVSEYFSRVVVNDPASKASIIFTQAFEAPNPAKPSLLPVIIDIDVFKQSAFPVNDNEYWQLLSTFHDLKNTAFFASLTPRTLETLK